MNWLFLQNTAQETYFRGEDLAMFFGGLVTILIFLAVFFIAVYVYTSFALMAIAKKIKTEPAWLAWIPVANFYLISKMAKMHWWPMLLLLTIPLCLLFFAISLVAGLVFLVPTLICLVVFTVFTFIWQWKMFEAVDRPGWWILMVLIPYVGEIIYLVLLGVAAWGEPKSKIQKSKSKRSK